MSKHTAFCPNCNMTQDMEIDPSKAPFRCSTCGVVMIIKSEQPSQSNVNVDAIPQPKHPNIPPPQYSYPLPPIPPPIPPVVYSPYPYPHPQPKKSNNIDLIKAMLISAGILGWLFWLSYFLVGYVHGTFDLDFTDPGSTTFLMFSLVMLASSTIAFAAGFKKSLRTIVLGSVFGIISFGFLIGSVLSLVSLFLTIESRHFFES